MDKQDAPVENCNPLYVVTGSAGHLGGTIMRMLDASGDTARGLLLPDEAPVVEGPRISYVQGNVCDANSLRSLFEGAAGQDIVVIHTAALISIAREMPPMLREVNVGGTKNILQLCQEYGVRRLVHVSSVHAIPELPAGQPIREVGSFSADAVEGAYAKTKAEAAQAVMDAAANGLDATIMFPSGIIGPYDNGSNHLVQMVIGCMTGTLPACVKGGYDFVDVRDVADGCLKAVRLARKGEGYILTGHYSTIQDLLSMVAHSCGRREIPVMPTALAKLAVPFIEGRAKLLHTRALYTGYSLHTLESNGLFSNEKARRELGYSPRSLTETVADMVAWLEANA